MKVLDIIVEASPPSGPVPPGMRWNGTMYVPIDTPKDPKSDPKKTPRKRPKRDKPLPVPGRRTPPVDSIESSKVPAKQPDGWDKIKDRWKTRGDRYDAYVDQGVPKYLNRISGVVRFFMKAAGLLGPLVVFYGELAKLEKDYIDEVYPFDTGDDQMDNDVYNSMRNFMWGKFLATEGAIIASRSLVWVLRATLWTRTLKNVAAFLSAGATFGTSVAVALATEAGLLWFSNWLSGPEGKKWWENEFIAPYLRFGGAIVDTAWQALVMAYTKATGGKAQTSAEIVQDKREKKRAQTDPDNQNGRGDQRERLPTEPPPSQSAVDFPSNIRTWVNGGWAVGGHPVTDGRGFLTPGVQNVLSVQGARREAQRRNLPDPLADIPAAPGQKHPGAFVD